MEVILSGYKVNQPTWFYLSTLLILAVFIRFNRVWSVRNLDLILLLSISPGLMFLNSPVDKPIAAAQVANTATSSAIPSDTETEHGNSIGTDNSPMKIVGYFWLFAVAGVLLVRIFFDALLKRRPRLEPNMNIHGLAFLCIAAFAFQTTKVLSEPLPDSTVETAKLAEDLVNRQDSKPDSKKVDSNGEARPGPAARLLAAPVVAASGVNIAVRVLAILSHLAAIIGLILLGKRHFGETYIGLSMATVYLLLPCTAFEVGKLNHVLPSVLIIWAFVAYRRPMVAGILMGLASGTMFFPLFLLPLWATFYGKRGALKFGLALGIVTAIVLVSIAMTSADSLSFKEQTIGSIDWGILTLKGTQATGFWSSHNTAYRIPVMVAFVIMTIALTVFPLKKDLEHLIAHSAAIIVATQLWYPQQGGVYVLWYLPIVLMVVFRPRLTHQVPRTELDRQEQSEFESQPRELAVGGSGGPRLFR